MTDHLLRVEREGETDSDDGAGADGFEGSARQS